MNSTVEHLGINTGLKGGDEHGLQEERRRQEEIEPLEIRLLKDELRKAASLCSYYNAAEGATWSNEKQDRAATKVRFTDAMLACKRLGIDTATLLKGYLL
jgi:hypothetical protein